MATVIDALVMTLGLDVAEFDKNRKRSGEDLEKFKKQADSVAKDVANGGKLMAEGFRAIKAELLGVLAVAGAATGLKEFIGASVKGQAELGRLSKNLGMSGAKLQAWGVIAEEMGGKASDAFGALQSIAGGLAEASIRGHSALTDMARANGVVLTDAKGQVLSYEDALLSISKRMVELPRQQAMYLANQLGVGSMFNELMLGPDELRRRQAEAERLSGVTQESIARAMELQRQWALIKDRLSVFGKTGGRVFAAIEPVLNRLATAFADWLDSIDWDHVADVIGRIGDEFIAWLNGIDWGEVRKDVGDFIQKVKELVEELGGWKAVAIALGGVLVLKVLSPVLGLVGGLGRLIPLITSTTAGLWALAAAGAAVAGYGIGTLIHKQIEGTKADDAIGYSVALVKSAMGDEEATKAILRNEYGVGEHVSNQRVKDLVALDRARQARGVRNHNPGNLNFAGQPGAHLETGPNARFAAFGTMQEGIAALITQLGLYAKRGIDTISGIVKTYAPAADGNNVAAYIAALVKATGHGANEHLDLSNLDTLIPLVQGIARHEGNGNLTTEQVLGGIRLGASQRAAARGTGMVSRTSTSETHIGKIEVHTPATDAKGIVRDIGHELSNNALIAQADTGVQ